MNKFKEDFYLLLNKLRKGEPFSFSRFSDGEMFILQNKKVILDQGLTQTGEEQHGIQYDREDFKSFIPEQDQKTRERLLASFTYSSEGYYRGLPCPCCVKQEDFLWMKELARDDGRLTYANLLVNSNYPLFVNEMIPAIANCEEIYLVCNEKAKWENLPFELDEVWNVGYNCPVNDVSLIDDIRDYILRHEIEGAVFLFSAASLSEFLCHELHKTHPKNMYIDIGTTLHYHMGLTLKRSYLHAYWSGQPHPDLFKNCTGI